MTFLGSGFLAETHTDLRDKLGTETALPSQRETRAEMTEGELRLSRATERTVTITKTLLSCLSFLVSVK